MNIDTLSDQLFSLARDKASKADFKAALEKALAELEPQTEFGFASWADGSFELIVRDKQSFEETTLKGHLEPEQFEQVCKVLPTCVFVDVETQDQIQQLTAQLAACREQYKDLARIASARYCGHCDLGYQEDDCTCGNYALATPSPAADALLQDRERLDWLDECNRRLNQHCGTVYGWELILSHNVTRLMLESPFVTEFAGVDLNDAAANGKLTCREAIDAARQAKASSGEGM